jgi:secondary thiamine-phosphate synthase enzyme
MRSFWKGHGAYDIRVTADRLVTRNDLRSLTREITIRTENRYDIVRLTDIVRQAVKDSGITEGFCLVNPMHITASVFINDDENGLHNDFMAWLERLAPYAPDAYRHNLTGEDNADAHLKRTIMGRETMVAITDGDLQLGPWEELFYAEFDGQRPKRILIKIVGF